MSWKTITEEEARRAIVDAHIVNFDPGFNQIVFFMGNGSKLLMHAGDSARSWEITEPPGA